jgi:hypothetical protein
MSDSVVPRSNSINRRIIGPLAIIIALYIALAINYLSFTVDDPFITLRYAAHLAQGEGLVYNPGERVEGMSNFLFTIMVAGIIKCGGDGLLGAKLLGILFGAGTVLVVFLFSLSVNRNHPSGALIAPLFLVAHVPFLVWSVGALETTLYLFLFTLGLYLLYHEASQRRFPWAASVFGLLALTRPEGIFFGIALLAAANIVCGKLPLRWNLGALILLALVFVPFECWRIWYYGQLLPNTVGAKLGGHSLATLAGTLREYFAGYVVVWGGAALLLAAVIPRKIEHSKYGFAGLCIAAILLQSGYVLAVNGDWMPGYRFFIPVSGVVAIILGEAYRSFCRFYVKKGTHQVVVVTILLLLLGVNLVTGHREFKQQYPGFYSWYKKKSYDAMVDNVASNPNYKRMADWINANVPDKRATLAIGEAGFIPYATGLKTVDLYGLTNPEVLSLPGVRKGRMGAELVSVEALTTGVLCGYLKGKKVAYLLLARFGDAPELGKASLCGNNFAVLHVTGNLVLYRCIDNTGMVQVDQP